MAALKSPRATAQSPQSLSRVPIPTHPWVPRAPAPPPPSPCPSAPAPASLRPSTPAPASPCPSAPTPASPHPSAPTPVSPHPSAPAPVSPHPSAPAPASPRPSTPAPASPCPPPLISACQSGPAPASPWACSCAPGPASRGTCPVLRGPPLHRGVPSCGRQPLLCQLRGWTLTHSRPTAYPLQTLQAAPPCLGSSGKSQRGASDSSETPATTCGPEHAGTSGGPDPSPQLPGATDSGDKAGA